MCTYIYMYTHIGLVSCCTCSQKWLVDLWQGASSCERTSTGCLRFWASLWRKIKSPFPLGFSMFNCHCSEQRGCVRSWWNSKLFGNNFHIFSSTNYFVPDPNATLGFNLFRGCIESCTDPRENVLVHAGCKFWGESWATAQRCPWASGTTKCWNYTVLRRDRGDTGPFSGLGQLLSWTSTREATEFRNCLLWSWDRCVDGNQQQPNVLKLPGLLSLFER